MKAHSYSPAISNVLRQYAEARNWEGICRYLATLTHSQFRTASSILCDETLLLLRGSDFWECFLTVVPSSPKAFLTTFLKAAVRLYEDGLIDIHDKSLAEYAGSVSLQENDIDEKKTMAALLPIVRTVEEINELFKIFGVESVHRKVAYLMPCNGIAAYYVLFQCFRRMDHAPELLSFHCNRLMAKGEDRAFNLVSIMKCYFDLPSVKGTFSLKLSSYELSRLDSSFDDFRKIICRI